MAPQDDPQQGAELRQAFLRHLPRRLETLIRRGRRLAEEGRDINALSLLLREVQTVAGVCGRCGLLELGARLFATENFLASFVARGAVPDAVETATFDTLIDAIAVLRAELAPPAPALVEPADPDPGRSEKNDYPLQRTAPVNSAAEFARKGVEPEPPEHLSRAEPAATAEPEIAVLKTFHDSASAKPIIATPASVATKHRVYHLSDGHALACELDQRLKHAGWELTSLESVGELGEMISALPPHLVLIDAYFISDLDVIGEVMRGARAQVSHRIAVLALSEIGDLAVRLRAMRAGVDAFITLPATAAEVLVRVSELVDPEAADPFRVLIVEDDRLQAMFAESILRKAGMHTDMVTEPLALLDELERFRPDLVLMDLYMPGCDGMELTALIREREAFVSMPIVFLSGEQDAEKHFAALNAGGDDFLSKPIRPKHLVSAVTNRLRRARQLARRTQNRNPRDPTTGLYDRAHLLDRINAKLADETASHRGGIVLAALDAAPSLRERLGLIGFESLLGQVGAFLAGHVGANQLAARFGDGGFLVLDNDEDEAHLVQAAAALRERVGRETFDAGGQKLRVEVSFGVCGFAAGPGDAGAMLGATERSLLEARRPGGGHVGVHRAQQSGAAALRETIATALRGDGFQLLFQPIVSLQGGEDEQFQVLLRLPGDGGRLHTAAEIVPIAEQAGLIDEIDRWVLARCLLVLSERARLGRAARLFVNQSATAMRDEGRVDWLRQQLETRKLASDALVLELRFDPHASEEALAAFVDFVARFKQLGVLITLAGIDATPATFAALDRIPADFLRLSPQAATQHRDDLRRVVAYAHERGRRVIAPGVEDATSAAQLWTAGVDFIQGNFVQHAHQDLNYDFRATAS